MCRASRRLISSTSAASVVVLPEPVGPPIRTSPRGSCASSFDGRRQAERGEARHARRQQPDRRRGAAALAMQVDPEPADARDPEGRVGDVRVAVDAPRVRRQRRQHRFLDVHAVERPLGERLDAAVDAYATAARRRRAAVAAVHARPARAASARAAPGHREPAAGARRVECSSRISRSMSSLFAIACHGQATAAAWTAFYPKRATASWAWSTVHHSSRSTTIGSTRVARLAGM